MAKSRKPKNSGDLPKRGKNPKEAVVLVPLSYNDGTKVPGHVIRSILQEVYVAFHGWTEEGTVKGAYRMQTGQKCVEELLKLSIVLDQTELAELEDMVAKWGAMLGQETMLLKIADATIKFIPPRQDGE